jgi:uncharacterized membrane protein
MFDRSRVFRLETSNPQLFWKGTAMSVVEKTVEVQCPLSQVYNQWTQFETFPRFMEGVEEVKQLDDTHLHWHAEIAGVDREWDAEITDQVPDRKIAWRSITGPENGGTVTFQQVDPQRTRVTLRMEYDPKGFVEKAADMIGVIERRIEGDMKRFRDFIEERGQETGAWRGDVKGGSVRNKPH